MQQLSSRSTRTPAARARVSSRDHASTMQILGTLGAITGLLLGWMLIVAG